MLSKIGFAIAVGVCALLYSKASVLGQMDNSNGNEKSMLTTNNTTLLESANLYFPYFKSIKHFDPHFLVSASDACLSQNLYSRLVSLTDDGQITGDLADDIAWDGTSYRLHVREGTKTIDGFPIGTNDVVTSLTRNFRLEQNTHGNLRMLMNEDGIRTDNGFVYLTPKDPQLKAFLITLLASPDFAIIPAVSLDLSKNNMPIRDWRNSSGLYYLDQDSDTGAFTLRINSNHHFFSDRQVKVLKLHPGLGYDAVELFNSGAIDIIPTPTVADSGDFLNVDKSVGNIHQTENIHLTALFFTARGLKNFSPAERLKIGTIVKLAILRNQKPGTWSPAEQYLPRFGEGALSQDQILSLRSLIAASAHEPVKKSAVFGVYPSKLDYFRKILDGELHIQVEPTKGRPPWLEPEDRQPDLYFSMGDSTFFESLSLLHYNFEQGTFLDRGDGMAWLQSYLKVESKKNRIDLIRELHYRALANGRIIPVLAEPYYAVSRKPLSPNFSKFYAGSPFWKLIIE